MGLQQILMVSSNFTPNVFAEYAVIAGGGGGAGELGGGGGAGGFRSGFYEYTIGTTYPINVGAGSPGPTWSGSNPEYTYYRGNPGSPSTFGPIVATGGGGGDGYWDDPRGDDGGSGGGSAFGGIGYGRNPSTPPFNGGPFSWTEGYPGGEGNGYGGGGGGGAGGTGSSFNLVPGLGSPAGVGGAGAPVTWPELPASYGSSGPAPGRWFASGGGGGGSTNYSRASTASNGAGGYTTGSGGPAGNSSSFGSAGVPGIVMLRVPISTTYTAPGLSASFAGQTHRVLIYTGPGSITFNN